MTAITDKWVHDLLEKECFLAHHAYFAEYFHNHLAHGIVALARLGAAQENIIQHRDFIVNRYKQTGKI